MNANDLQYEKINLINWITRLQDEAIIAKLKKIQLKEDSIDFPSMSVDEIIDQANQADQEIKQGNVLSHEAAYEEFKKWK